MGAKYLVEIGATLTGAFKSAFGQAGSSARELGATINRLNQSVRDVDSFRALSAETGKLKSAYDQAKEKARELGREIDATEKPTRKQMAAFRMAIRESEEAEKAWREQSRELRTLGSALQRAGVDTDRLADEQKRLATEATKAKRAMSGAEIGESMARNRQFRGDMRGRMFDAVAMGTAVGAPTLGAFNAFANFESGMVAIGNTANMTETQIKSLGQSIMVLSKETGQSATTMQNAMQFLIAAGMDAKTAEASLRAIGRTATASGAEIEDIAKAAFTLNDSLKIDPKNIQTALDILAQAGKEGNVELKDMAKVLPVLGSGFVALKMEGTEAAATMGAALEIARKGAANADEAANNMQNFVAKIMSPETLKKAEKNFDLDLYKIIQDAQTTGKNPFEESVKAIMKATQGDQKKIGELFGDMQVQNFIRPLMQNWDEYQRIKDKALSAQGVVDKDFEAVSRTSKQNMKELGNAWERLKITAGEGLAPALTQLVQELTPIVEKVGALVKENPKLVTGFVAIGTAAAAVAGGLAGIGWIGSYAKEAFLMLRMAVVPLFTSGGLLASGGAVATGFTAVGAAIAATPIGWLIGGIALVAAGAALVYKYWQPLGAFFSGFWQGFSEGMAPVLRDLKPFGDLLVWVGGKVMDIAKFFWDLLAPVQLTSTEFAKAESLGKKLGEVFAWIATKAAIVIEPLRAVGSAVGWIMEKAGIGGGEEAKPSAPAPAPVVPNGANRTINNQSQFNINLHGTGNAQSDARAITEHLDAWDRQKKAQQRSSLTDTPSLAY